MTARFIDIHVIQSVPPSCVNRDDTGAPKSAVYGGTRRARVSSQAWKRAARTEFAQILNSEDLGVRTTRAVGLIAEAAQRINPELTPEQAVQRATGALKAAKLKIENRKRKDDDEGAPESSYLIFFSNGQIERLGELIATEEKVSKNDALEAADAQKGIEVSLFGRMVADNTELSVDASVQVAHALSTHAVETESDYFTAVDDMRDQDEPGAGMIGLVDFNSSTLYRYATINIDGLRANLGDDEATARAVDAFIRAFALSMPTGKQNTFANRTVPDALVVSVREDQPVNLVGAFEDAVSTAGGRGTVAESSRRLADRMASVGSFVKPAQLTVAAVSNPAAELPGLSEPTSLDSAVKAVVDAVRNALAAR